jgi:uncharacterized protein YndB with AHSA1/START domain
MSGPVLTIKKVFNAKPEELFEAWTDPAQVAEWYGPEGFAKSDIHSFDLREGGSYSLTMNAPDGAKHKLRGTFREVDKPNKLVFTWQWEEGGRNNMTGEETLVTVEFNPVGTQTEMTFTHSGFVNEMARDNHNMGWTGSFNKLELLLKQ